MKSLGADLKDAREQKKIPLEQIAAETRISLRYLRSLENGQYADMPGGMYNRAFLRAYCEHLGLDAKPYLARYEMDTSPPGEKTTKSKRSLAVGDTFLSRPHPLAAWSIMLLVSAIGLYFSRGWIARVFSPYFARTPASTIAPRTVPEPQPTSTASLQEASARVASPATADTAAPLTTEPDLAGKIHLQIIVLQECWVSVDSDGTRALVKLLEPGDDQSFEAMDRFYVILGNAGGVRLKINGKPAKPPGKPGEVVRILINARNIESLLEKVTG